MRFCANLSLLFTEVEPFDRPAAAAEAGFAAAEWWWPFETPVPDTAAVDRFVTAMSDAGLTLAGLNFFAGDMPAGDRGVLSDPERSPSFRDNIPVAVDLAGRLGCRVLNALYGNRVEGVHPAEQDELALENLRLAAEAAEGIGATVGIEAVNDVDNPRYPLTTTPDALAVIEHASRIGVDLGLIYDAFHMQRTEGDLITTLTRHLARLIHVQVADVPGRHEPGTGEINFSNVFDALDAAGYDGFIGLEYRPRGRTLDGLGWLPPERRVTWP